MKVALQTWVGELFGHWSISPHNLFKHLYDADVLEYLLNTSLLSRKLNKNNEKRNTFTFSYLEMKELLKRCTGNWLFGHCLLNRLLFVLCIYSFSRLVLLFFLFLSPVLFFSGYLAFRCKSIFTLFLFSSDVGGAAILSQTQLISAKHACVPLPCDFLKDFHKLPSLNGLVCELLFFIIIKEYKLHLV